MILRFLNFAPMLLLIISVYVFTPLLSNYYYYWDYFLAPRYNSNEIFDFIIIGAGSAGSVIANRLSKNNKVLLLEAGGDPVPFVSIPLLAQDLMHMPQLNWNHKTIPQKYSSRAMNDKISLWPRGKLLGGTSNLNYMFYVRGNPLDYDNWAKITGDEDWNYDNVLPYFKKSLDYHGAYSSNEKHYGETPYGYLHVESRSWDPLYQHFIDACKELGYPEVDVNGPQVIGFGRAEVTQKKGSRAGTYTSFLKNAMNRKNLQVSRYSIATKIKLDGNNHAEGVYYLRHGKKYYARASKEIILSGGSVESPKILALSGIGPKDHLQSLNIKPKIDLPVGQNLKDHFAFLLGPFSINESLSIVLTRDFGVQTMYDYFVKGQGPITSPGLLTSHGFVASKFSPNPNWPDLQIYLSEFGIYSETAKDFSRILGFNKTILNEYLHPILDKEMDAFTLLITLVLPKSVGEIKLKDKNPLTPPIIDPRYLEDERDVKTLVEGIKIGLKIAEETKSFKKLNAKLLELKFPGCEHFSYKSDKYWECFIRQIGLTLYHPVGSCRMGKAERDPKAVVDSKLRVLHTKNLRIADASIFPEIPNGNTNAPAIMVGEKAADLIRAYWAQQFEVCDYFDYLFNEGLSRCYYVKLV